MTRNGIIGILICIVLYVISEYLSGIPLLGFFDIFKWFFILIAVILIFIVALANISNKK